jgi:hypothetical protein
MQLRKAIRGAVRKATRRMAAIRKATLARRLAPLGRRQGHPLDTPITPRRHTRPLRDMDQLAQQVATAQETAVDRIRQLPATARVAALDRARFTAAVAQPRPIRRRAPRAVLAEGIAPQAEAEAVGDRTPPVAVAAIPVVVVAGTAEADIANMV